MGQIEIPITEQKESNPITLLKVRYKLQKHEANQLILIPDQQDRHKENHQ